MEADMLYAFTLLAVFAGVFFLHQFTIIRRQHLQIIELEKLLALRTGDPNVELHIDRQTDLERDRQNQANDHEPRVILRPAT